MCPAHNCVGVVADLCDGTRLAFETFNLNSKEMAKQKGILKFEGTIGGMTFYESQDGSLVREKGGVSGERIAKDPRFARTRENNEEFANAGKGGKYITDALRTLMKNVADNRVTGRLTKVMTDLVKLDAVNIRGKRVPAEGVKLDAGLAMLKGFNFNIKAIMGSILFKPYVLDKANGSVTINGLSPLNDIAWPLGATHFKLGFTVAIINLATGENKVVTSSTDYTELKPEPIDRGLVLQMPEGEGIKLYILRIEFTQMMNNAHYSLKNGSYNAMSIIDVEGASAQASPLAKASKKA